MSESDRRPLTIRRAIEKGRAGRWHVTAMQIRVLVLVALMTFFAIASPYFLTAQNLVNVVVSAAVVGILADAMTLLIVAGLVDVSVGSGVGFAAAAFSVTYEHHGLLVALLAALGAAFAIEAVNVTAIIAFGVSSIIATLATKIAFVGVQDLTLNGQNVAVGGFTFLGQTRFTVFGVNVPVAALVLIGVTGFFYLLMRFTKYGLHMYALGANPRAARLAGIRLERRVLIAFALMACSVALASLILTSQVGVVDPTTGMNLEFLALTAVMIGGASLYGGRGSVTGTIVAIAILSVLNNGLVLVSVSSFWQQVVQGSLLLGAVMFDQIGHRSRDVKLGL